MAARKPGARPIAPRISTKIAIPRRRGDTLRRNRLVDVIHEQIDRQLFLIVAPAGYGKTTLLVDFASDSQIPVCWYSLGPSDAEPAIFLDYLIASIQARFPRFGADTRRLMAQVTDFRTDMLSVVAALVNEVQDRIPDYFAVVLDDYHEVNGNSAINDVVDAILKHAPENLKLVLASRTMPRLQLARMAALRQAAGVGAKDLRFTSDEVRDLMRDSYHTVLPERVVEELTLRSEGWITGIILTTHTMWQGLFESMIQNSGQEQLYSYLANEVFERQTGDVQHFLLATSILDDMEPAIAGPLAGMSPAAEILHQLEEANLFVSELEGRKRVYRYHHLFRDFLRSRLDMEAGAPRIALERHAGQLYQQRGQHEQAVRHLLAAADWPASAESILALAEDAFNRGRLDTLAAWVDTIPANVALGYPRLALWRAQVAIQKGELKEAVGLCQGVEREAEATGDRSLAAEATAHRAAAVRLLGDDEAALDLCRQALAVFGDESTRQRAVALRNMSMASWRLGHFPFAREQAAAAHEVFEAIGDRASAAYVQNDLGMLAVLLGRLGEARQQLRASARFWASVGNAGRLGMTTSNLAVISYLEEDYEEAIRLFGSAIEHAQAGLFTFAEAAAICSAGDVYRDRGELEVALASYENARDLVLEGADRAELAVVLNSMAQTYRLQGQYAKAATTVRHARANASGYGLAQLHLTEGMCLVEQGQHKAATRALDAALDVFRQGGARYPAARALFHLALNAFRGGSQKAGDAYLEQCLATLRELGYWQFLTVDVPRARDFVEQAAERRVDEGFFVRLLTKPGRLEAARQRAPEAAPAPMSLRVKSLGRVEVQLDGKAVSAREWGTQSARDLLLYLLLHPEGAPKERLMSVLAPEATPARANSQFHMAAYRLRRALYKGCIVFSGDYYRLDPRLGCEFDVAGFRAALARADRSRHAPVDERRALAEAIDYYGGAFLDGSYAEWALDEQRRLEEQCLSAASRLASGSLCAGDFEAALTAAERGLAIDNSLEELHEIALRALLGLRRNSEARIHLHAYGVYLDRELGAPLPAALASLLEDSKELAHASRV